MLTQSISVGQLLAYNAITFVFEFHWNTEVHNSSGILPLSFSLPKTFSRLRPACTGTFNSDPTSETSSSSVSSYQDAGATRSIGVISSWSDIFSHQYIYKKQWEDCEI